MFYTVGKDASEVMSTFLLVRVTPKSWEANGRETATKFASFVTARVYRGVYWVDGHHLHLRTVGPHQSAKTYWPGVFANPDVLLPQFTNDPGRLLPLSSSFPFLSPAASSRGSANLLLVHGPLFGAEDWASAPWLRFNFVPLERMDFRGVLHTDEDISDEQMEIIIA